MRRAWLTPSLPNSQPSPPHRRCPPVPWQWRCPKTACPRRRSNASARATRPCRPPLAARPLWMPRQSLSLLVPQQVARWSSALALCSPCLRCGGGAWPKRSCPSCAPSSSPTRTSTSRTRTGSTTSRVTWKLSRCIRRGAAAAATTTASARRHSRSSFGVVAATTAPRGAAPTTAPRGAVATTAIRGAAATSARRGAVAMAALPTAAATSARHAAAMTTARSAAHARAARLRPPKRHGGAAQTTASLQPPLATAWAKAAMAGATHPPRASPPHSPRAATSSRAERAAVALRGRAGLRAIRLLCATLLRAKRLLALLQCAAKPCATRNVLTQQRRRAGGARPLTASGSCRMPSAVNKKRSAARKLRMLQLWVPRAVACQRRALGVVSLLLRAIPLLPRALLLLLQVNLGLVLLQLREKLLQLAPQRVHLPGPGARARLSLAQAVASVALLRSKIVSHACAPCTRAVTSAAWHPLLPRVFPRLARVCSLSSTPWLAVECLACCPPCATPWVLRATLTRTRPAIAATAGAAVAPRSCSTARRPRSLQDVRWPCSVQAPQRLMPALAPASHLRAARPLLAPHPCAVRLCAAAAALGSVAVPPPAVVQHRQCSAQPQARCPRPHPSRRRFAAAPRACARPTCECRRAFAGVQRPCGAWHTGVAWRNRSHTTQLPVITPVLSACYSLFSFTA